MRSDAPPLLPIFRSRHQAELLALLYLQPEREFTLTELAARLDAPLSTIQREASRLVQAGLLLDRRVGRAHLLRAKAHGRYAKPLTELLTLSFGPHTFIEQEFAHVPGADALAIFGSWARRYHGEPGPPPNDIDVLVVGPASRADVYESAERVESRLGIPVNPVLVTVDRWKEAANPLVEQIKSSPVVWVRALSKGTA
ncbi:MarR family transcriptional regulator [Microbispora catharanthi]|uniref:MarR family transcriptional regulator n=1 Tax=Microbispora catharanthi TaxID=1712871 RepID=A0A5N6BRH6_9ACTN|nr:MarR family transcriptional regulator [Microbispora catharanthi]